MKVAVRSLSRFLAAAFLIAVLLVGALPAQAQQPGCCPPPCDASLVLTLRGCIDGQSGYGILTVCNDGAQGTSTFTILISVVKGVAVVTPNVINDSLGPGQTKSYTLTLTNVIPVDGEIKIRATVIWESCRPDHNIGKSVTEAFRGCPTAVTFTRGCAHRLLEGNIIRWETASEVDNRGFFVRYHPDRNGFDNSGVVNPMIISSKGGVAGASYSYFDRKKPADGFYWIVAIDAYGVSDVLGPIQLTDRPKASSLVKVSTTISLFQITWTGPADEPYEVIVRAWTPEWGSISNVQTILVPSGNELRLVPGFAKGYYDVKVKASHGTGTIYKRFRVKS